MNDQRQSLREQLTEVRRSTFSNIPRVRPVMQMMLQSGSKSAEGRAAAIRTVLDWADLKWPGLIPRQAWGREDFEHDRPGLKLAAVHLAEKGIWGFAVEHLDTDAGVSRTWVIEAVVAELEAADLMAVRNQCSSAGVEDVPATSPRFVRQWVERQGLVDDEWPVRPTVHILSSAQEVDKIVAFLKSKNRQLPVVVASELGTGAAYAIELSRLSQRIAGLAHVIGLPMQLSFGYADLIGKSLSVFNGAVRTYYPALGQGGDTEVHPNILPERIASWQEESGEGSEAFVAFLVRQIHRFSVNSPKKLEQHPGLARLRREQAESVWARRAAEIEARRRELDSVTDKGRDEELELMKLELEEKVAEIEQAKKARDEEMQRANDNQQVLEMVNQELIAANDELEAFRGQNENLIVALRKQRKGNEEIRFPKSYVEIPAWVDEYFADHVLLLPRAKRALKGAEFEDVELVFRCIRLLAEEYWRLRTASKDEYEDAKRAFGEKLKHLGVDEEASITPTRLGELREQYTVDYTIGQSSTQILNRHLRGGSSTKENRYCLRIYFFWDDARQKVVVGHLPSHLETRAS